MKFAASVVVLVGVLFPAVGHAQSFNCNYAKRADEILICQDERLSRLDERLASLYSRTRDIPGVAQDEEAWLRSRMDCGRNLECIEDHYTRRIEHLERELDSGR